MERSQPSLPPVGDSWTAARGEPVPETPHPAGVLRRAVALAVDVFVLWLLWRLGRGVGVLLVRWEPVARAFLVAYALVVPAAYLVLAHGTGGRTLGKWLAGVRVVRVDGAPPGYLQALGRLLAWLLSAALLGAGFLLVPLRRDRRALHDLLAGTRVVRAR